MNLDSLSFTLSQISYLVASLTKKNQKQVVSELKRLVSLHGLEADRHLLQCLFSAADFTEPTNKIITPSLQNQVLLDQCSSVINKPSLLTSVCYITDNPFTKPKIVKFGCQFFQQLSKCLRLSAVQEVVFALALRHSSNTEIVTLAQNHLRSIIPLLVQSYIDTEGSSRQHEGGLHETTPEILHLIVSSILKAPKEFGLTNESHQQFINTLQRDFPKDLVPIVLAPLIYSDNCELVREMSSEGPGLSGGMLETSLADIITEIGYNFTSSIEECKNNLIKYGGGQQNINSTIIARIISVMCRTHSGLDDTLNPNKDNIINNQQQQQRTQTWNIDIFVQSIKEIQPNLQWNKIVGELDNSEFIIKDRQGLIILINIIRQGIHQTLGYYHQDSFPIDYFYKRWNNVEGQFSLIQNILKNPDIFCFIDYPCITVSIDILKTPPEQDNKELSNWRSLNLIELLLNLSEYGLYNYIQELFKYPLHNCPDILILALLQINGPITILRQELLTNLIPIFLVNHPNSAIILHHAWHGTTNINIKSIIMQSMAEWYVRSDCDQTRLSRILDVAQDLKALSMLLNAQNSQSYPFIIDLACLASRREYLKLEKWLSDKIREHGETFIMALIKFLHRRCPQIVVINNKNDDSLITKSSTLPNETITTIMICLQSCINNVTPECQEAIIQVTNNCAILLKSRQSTITTTTTTTTTILRQRTNTTSVAAAAAAAIIDCTTFNQQQLYNHNNNHSGIDSIITNMTITPSGTTTFNLTSGLGPLVQSSPGSPSRILGAVGPSSSSSSSSLSNSPFPPQMIPIQQQQQQHQGPIGGGGGGGGGVCTTNSSLILGINQIGGNIGRIQQQNSNNIDQSYNLFPEFSSNVSKDIEDEANSYFQRIYNHPPHPTLSIDEVLDMLKRFQDSPNKREREVFNCMLRNLFEEYKFFPKYPDKELFITAQLFGGIIERGIVASYIALGLALRFVLEALKKPEGSKMYYFGIAALDRFKSRLKEYHKYCEHVRAIPHFNDFPPHLQEYVEYGLQSMEPPNKPQGPCLPPSMLQMMTPSQQTQTTPSITTQIIYKSSTIPLQQPQPQQLLSSSTSSTSLSNKINCIITTTTTTTNTITQTTTTTNTLNSRPSIANATNIDTLLVATEKDEKVISPPENLQDKTAFIFNNLSQLNLKTKCEELKELITDEYYPWLAQYLVMKRASIELNFHQLYSNFLDTLNIQEIYRLVTKETYRNIKVLLRSDKGIENFSDRSLLKNLGHWLGMLTLARNKPILQIDLDLKSLLVEAYNKGQQELLYVVPFVAKIIESCAKSKVFKPQNPWTMAIMNVLAELHQEQDLKLTLKFEIEVLCKNLDIDITQLKPIMYLKDPERINKIEYQLSQQKHNQKQQHIITTNNTTNTINTILSSSSSSASSTSMINNEQELINIIPGSGLQQQQQQQRNSPIIRNNSTTPTSSSSSLSIQQQQQQQQQQPEPRFNYNDIQINNGQLNSFQTHTIISPTIILFQNQPQLKPLVRSSIEHAVQEWIAPVVDRSIKIAIQTCEQIIRKDFALDPDENRMRLAAHYMVRNLTAGMAMITCRDQLLTAINTHLKQALLSSILTPTLQQKEMIEQASNIIANDNMELACAFVQKTAVEKAIPEIDKRLMNEYDLRKMARQEGRRYCDSVALTYQAERMPEQIRLKVGGISASQMAVYEEFARNIPGFLPNERADSNILIQNNKSIITQHIENQTHPIIITTTTTTTTTTPPTTIQPFPQLPQSTIPNDDLAILFEKLAMDIEQYIQAISGQPQYAHINGNMLLLRDCLMHTLRNRDLTPPQAIVQKCVESLQDCLNCGNDTSIVVDPVIIRFKELIIRVLKTMQDPRIYGQQWTNKLITRFLTECREEYRYNIDAVDILIKSGLVHIPQYDIAIAQFMENGLNYIGVQFAMQLIQLYLIDERNNQFLNENDLCNTIEMLLKIHTHTRQPPDGLNNIIDILRQQQQQQQQQHENLFFLTNANNNNNNNNEQRTQLIVGHNNNNTNTNTNTTTTAHIHNGILQVRTAPNYEDPPGLVEKTDYLLREWITMYNQSNRDPTKAFSMFVHQMNLHGILKTDDLITRFFRLSTQLCVEAIYRIYSTSSSSSSQSSLSLSSDNNKCTTINQTQQTTIRSKCYNTLDAFVRLVSLLVKHSGDANNTNTKIHLLNKVLGIVAGCLLQDHETRTIDFNQLPYQRIFTMLFLELNAPEPILETINFHIISSYCHTLHIIRPTKAAAFSYAWLELISHRIFMGRILATTPQQKGWPLYAQLLIDLFKYLSPFLRNAELAKPVTILYKGTLRVLLILLHDFPEFLCDYHYGFCDVIPPNCIQMRNLILSAFPRTMRLPDPFTPNLKVDMLPEISYGPRILANIPIMITPIQFKKDLDSYLKARSPVTFLSELRSNLQISNEPGIRYNIPLMNALVLHVGMQAITYIRNKGHPPNMTTIAHSAHMDIFQNLAVDLDTEGRYLFLNAIANQLRYPNSHTHYFSCTLLYLFAEANTEAIQEQITRVLLERLIVNRPHPWGLLITFIELIKNPTYKFWTHEFVHCAPEIEKLFESVARSCMVSSKTTNQGQESEIQELGN